MRVQYSTRVQASKTEVRPYFTKFAKRNKTVPLLISHRSDRQASFCAFKAMGQRQAAYYFLNTVGSPACKIANPRGYG